MRRDIVIADDFYADPDEIVRYALSLNYMFPYNSLNDEEAGKPIAWRTSRFRSAGECPLKSSEELRARLELLTGEKIDLDFWNLDFPVNQNGYPVTGFEEVHRGCWWNCSFHVKHWGAQKLGEGVHSHTDMDIWSAVGVNGWVGLVYLTRDGGFQKGLNIWRNIDKQKQFDWMTPPENWELVDTLGSVFNRLILHRGGVPHSGSPGWGQTLEEGRLFQTFFFRTHQVNEASPVQVPVG
jgi:hypothetical protein